MPRPRRLIAVSRVVLVGSLPVLSACEPAHLERRWTVMGTYASADVYAATSSGAETAIGEIRRAFDRVDASMSNWKPKSELAVLNREAALHPVPVKDPDLFRCIEVSLEYARLTGGAFDPTVGPLMRLYGFRPWKPRIPSPEEIAETLRHVGWEKVQIDPKSSAVRFLDPGVELDLGGIAKGYALDVAARALARPGLKAALIDLGGNLYAWGHPPGAAAWRVGLRDPEDDTRILATVDLVNRAVATSGDYENFFVSDGVTYGHIMDPGTGRPADSDVIAATAIADRGADSDAMSKVLFVPGSRRAGEFLEKTPRIEAVMLVRDRGGLSLLASGSLKGRLTLDPQFAARIGGGIRYLLPPE